MNSLPVHTCDKRILLTSLLFIFSLFILISGVTASQPVLSSSSPVNASVPVMEVGVYMISMPSFDFAKGTYSPDFYLYFRWTDDRISGSHFELMNGRPSNVPSAVQLIYENKTGPVKEEWYRVRADLFIPPDIHDYPFESGTIRLIIEDANLDSSEMVYVPLTEESGFDPDFSIPGWNIDSYTISSYEHHYPWGENSSRVVFTTNVKRGSMESVLQTMVPPLIFCLISALSFFIGVGSDELVALRYGLGTSMFIAAVMYHFSQLASLPVVGVLKLFDKFMISIYVFLAVTLIVTTLAFLARAQWNKPEFIPRINRYGAVFAIILPIITFWILWPV